MYPLVSLVAVYMYLVSATKLSPRLLPIMYPRVEHCLELVSVDMLLVRETCIRLHVSGVNAA